MMDFLKTILILCSVLSLSSVVLCQLPRYVEKYITLPVDQFTFTADNTFQLRYLINDTFTNGNQNTPILFYCGNEANVEFFAKEAGFIWEFAPKINALVVFAEHRYYGKSLPFGNDSLNGTDYFAYLTIEQTLADFAILVEHLNEGTPMKRPTIAIGGSYGGILAALFRMKYPHLVAGALAASAPLRQVSNLTACDAYTKSITRTFQTAYTEHCASNVKRSWTTFRDIVANYDNGVEFFNQVFDFCEPWRSEERINEFLSTMDDVYFRMAMTNYPYKADIYTPLPANPIRQFCTHLDVEYYGRNLVKAFKKAVDVYTNPYGEPKCFEFPKRQLMQPHDSKAWAFQRCTELLTGTCEHEEDSMFLTNGENFEESIKSCRSIYGNRVDLSVHRINSHFGIDNLKSASRIIFSNGLLDPWAVASVLEAPNDQTLVINIPEGAHHIDLRFADKMDPPSVIQARALEELYMKKWIRAFRRESNHFM